MWGASKRKRNSSSVGGSGGGSSTGAADTETLLLTGFVAVSICYVVATLYQSASSCSSVFNRQQQQQQQDALLPSSLKQRNDGNGNGGFSVALDNDDESSPPWMMNPNASFGACLMIMDDSHFLAEWLSYHWFALPLRHVVVYIDRKSRTSPLPILERFSKYITFEIVDWHYPEAYSETPEFLKGSIHADPVNRKLIGEQLKFYEDCIRYYKRNNWNSWITLHDTDEVRHCFSLLCCV